MEQSRVGTYASDCEPQRPPTLSKDGHATQQRGARHSTKRARRSMVLGVVVIVRLEVLFCSELFEDVVEKLLMSCEVSWLYTGEPLFTICWHAILSALLQSHC